MHQLQFRWLADYLYSHWAQKHDMQVNRVNEVHTCKSHLPPFYVHVSYVYNV